MTDVYVMDKNLNVIGVVDAYKSLIWSSRYCELGDCELYVRATEANLNLLQKDFYLFRNDDDMVCRIKKIELTTSSEDGNYLIVTGVDVRSFLDQRIIWNTTNCNGNLETFIRQLVYDSVIGDSSLYNRRMKTPNGATLIGLGATAGLTEADSCQVSYANVGEKIREFCTKFHWGYKVYLYDNKFLFEVYKGTDRSDSVVFSDQYENLLETDYISDETNLGNTALIAGSGEGSERVRRVAGNQYESTERYEVFVDAKDLARVVTYAELKAIYPLVADGGRGYIVNNFYYYSDLDVLIVDADQLLNLQALYPDGSVVTIDGVEYYEIPTVQIADLPNSSPTDQDNVVWRDVIYRVYLLTRGYEKLAEYGKITSFSGSIEPNTTFVYKKDYFLGDIVTVQNSFGISVEARIVEVIEVNDDNGYSVQPTFEYISEV